MSPHGHCLCGLVDIWHLVTDLCRQTPPTYSGERGLHFVQILEACRTSCENGTVQDIPGTPGVEYAE